MCFFRMDDIMKIGVVIATYNGEKYISEQINSIIAQTRKPNYIVVSDAGSTDATVGICKNMLSQDSTIEYTVLESNVQLGVAENFQKGLLHCECDYVFFADQDDVWLPNKISTFIDIMERNDVAFAFSNAEIVDENLNSVNKSLWESINYSQEKAYCIYEKEDYRFVKELIRHNIVTGMCMCARKDLVNKIVPFDSEVLHDTWIAMNAALKVKTIAIAQKLVLYRQHQGNVIGTNTGIGKKLSRSSSYYLRVLNRKKMIKMIIDSNNIHNNEMKELLNNYYNFQIHRLQFMKRHLGFLWAIKNRERYLKLASDGKDILIKDYFIRITGLLERGKE